MPYFFTFKKKINILLRRHPKAVQIIDTKTLVIDNAILSKYNAYYFRNHPRAKKLPIKSPCHPSINEWMIMKRPMMNALKQKWKDFIVWFINQQGYTNLHIDKCEMIFTSYYKTNRRHDSDNSTPKFILDGLVESGFVVDDDIHHIKSLTLRGEIDRNRPRTEILVNINNYLSEGKNEEV